jgi:hypothetical protein
LRAQRIVIHGDRGGGAVFDAEGQPEGDMS